MMDTDTTNLSNRPAQYDSMILDARTSRADIKRFIKNIRFSRLKYSIEKKNRILLSARFTTTNN